MADQTTQVPLEEVTEQSPTLGDTGAPVPSPEPSHPSQEEEVTPAYTLGTWAGLPNWKCSYCEYATTIGEHEIQWHVVDEHPDK